MTTDLYTLNAFWFLMLGFLLGGYAILDGFDLGVGILHLIVKKDEERRILMNSIAPIWDGNEVWLVTFGGALFAAFPEAYATVFSGFYLAMMLLLFALIFRAVSMEFRSKRPGSLWRGFWDGAFSISSIAASLLFGVAVGNSISGLPLHNFQYFEGLPGLLKPYPLLIGLLTVSLFAMHGAIYLYLRTEGDLQKRVQRWIWTAFGVFLVFYTLATIATLVVHPHAITNFQRFPSAWIVVVLNVLAIANIPRCLYLGRPGWAFISSCCTIAALVFLFGMALFPNLVVSSGPDAGLTIFNAASSQKTLHIMQIMAFIGLPFVLGYTAVVYWIFRGKVKLSEHGY